MDSKTPIYIKLKILRSEHNMTQKELADHLHVSRQAISQWETGKSYPDIDNLFSLCRLYQIPLDTLLENENKTSTENNNSDSLIKKLIAAILSTIFGQFAVIGMIFPIIVFIYFKKGKRSISVFDLYIFLTLLSGTIQTYYFMY